MPRMISGAAQAAANAANAANAAAADAADALAAADAATPPTVTPPPTVTTEKQRTFVVEPKKARKGSEDPRTFKEWAEVQSFIEDAILGGVKGELVLQKNGISVPNLDAWKRVDRIVDLLADETDTHPISTPPDQTAIRAAATGDMTFVVSIGKPRSKYAIAVRQAARK